MVQPSRITFAAQKFFFFFGGKASIYLSIYLSSWCISDSTCIN
ncbi:hypothetical protein MEW_05463 [Candida albicans P60002]|nr:hypothetical protein MEW_05463 [Candida albicans P60002]